LRDRGCCWNDAQHEQQTGQTDECAQADHTGAMEQT
jgi:hypothetical protein